MSTPVQKVLKEVERIRAESRSEKARVTREIKRQDDYRADTLKEIAAYQDACCRDDPDGNPVLDAVYDTASASVETDQCLQEQIDNLSRKMDILCKALVTLHDEVAALFKKSGPVRRR